VAANFGGGVRLTFDGNYNDAVYTRAPSLPAPAELSYNGIANIDAAGQRAPYSPKWAFSATPSWDAQVAPGTGFYSYAQFSHITGYGTGVTQSAYTQVPAQSNLNLRAGLRLAGGRYDVSLFANNATNERNIISQACRHKALAQRCRNDGRCARSYRAQSASSQNLSVSVANASAR
jgi:iron complex outermembrane recepter protein